MFELNEDLFLEAGKYPEDWDMELFKSLPTFAKRVKYAQERLGKLGTGSARIVFSVDDNVVIKIAKNKKGLAQNSIEIDIGTKNWHNCTAKVFDYDPDNLWLEAEKARAIKKSDFKKIIGYNFDTWTSVLYFKILQLQNGIKYYILDQQISKEIMEGDFFNDIVKMSTDWDINPGDFKRINSWGAVIRNGKPQIVLVDVGLTNQIYNDYYYKK